MVAYANLCIILSFILILILFTGVICSFSSDNSSYSLSNSAYGTPETKSRFVELPDNSTGNLLGWIPDGKRMQFNITDPNVKNNSIVTSTVNSSPESGLHINLADELYLAEVLRGELFVIPVGLRPSSIFELDSISNTLSSTGIPVSNVLSPQISKVDFNNIYLCCQGSKILVINLPTLTITGEIDIGQTVTASRGPMFGPYSNKIYLPDWSISGVKSINTTTNNVTGTIFTGLYPTKIGFESPHKLYVLNSFYQSGTDGTVSVINATSNSVLSNIKVGNTPSDMLIDDIDHRIYVTNEGSPFIAKPNGTVSVIDSVSNKLLATLTVGQDPIQMLQLSFGDFMHGPTNIIYVLNRDSRTVSVINATSNKEITTIKLPLSISPSKMALNQKTNTIYVLDDKGVSVINATSFKVIKTIPITLARDLVISSTNTIYVSRLGTDENHVGSLVSVIDGSTNSLVPTNLVTCSASSIVDSKYFWLRCSGPPSENAVLNYSIEGP
jgi:YVTN family beta-propeller protein